MVVLLAEGSQTFFRILAIDGGGIRGVIPAHILHLVNSKFSINPAKHFDLIAGTSTGAIIAAAIACEVDLAKIVSLYRKHGSNIFHKRKSFIPSWPHMLRPAVHSQYEQNELLTALTKVFGDKKLGEIKIPLLLPSTDIGNGCVHVFKSGYSDEFVRDRNVLVRDAVLASCCAPTYFDPKKVDEYLLADGGLWANNPSLIATIEAIRRLKIAIDAIRVLSLGTGHARKFYEQRKRSWGLVTGWGIKDFISFILSLQSQAAHNQLKLLLPESQILRLDFESDRDLPLDDITSVDTLVSRSDKLFTQESERLRNFLKFD